MDAYNVPIKLPKYAAVKGRRSLEAICPNICCHPLSAPRDARTSAEPRLNVIANFDGERIIIGRKMKNAKRRKRAPVPARAAK